MSYCDSNINLFFIILIIILLFYERIFSCCFFWVLGFVMRIGILWLSFCARYCDGPRPELPVPLRFVAFTVLSTFLVLFHLGFPKSFVIRILKTVYTMKCFDDFWLCTSFSWLKKIGKRKRTNLLFVKFMTFKITRFHIHKCGENEEYKKKAINKIDVQSSERKLYQNVKISGFFLDILGKDKAMHN